MNEEIQRPLQEPEPYDVIKEEKMIDEIAAMTTETLTELAESAFYHRTRKEEYEALMEQESKMEREATDRLQTYLDFSGTDSFISKSGTIERRSKLSFTTPKTPEDKFAFFKYLQDKGVFYEVASVNSQTLNGFAKAEYEAMRDRGETPKIPGISEPKEYVTIHLRRSR